jgi:hypothetical protein
MPASARYFFHLVSDHEVIPDQEGVDLLADERVLSHVVRAVDELVRDEPSSDEWLGWRLEITDGAGQVILIIPLSRSNQGQHLLLPH